MTGGVVLHCVPDQVTDHHVRLRLYRICFALSFDFIRCLKGNESRFKLEVCYLMLKRIPCIAVNVDET